MRLTIDRHVNADINIHVPALAARAFYLALGVTFFGLMHLLGLSWSAFSAAIACTFAATWRRGGLISWLNLMLGVWAFLGLRAFADDAGMPVHTADLWQLERILFLGKLPSEVLQSIFFVPGQLGIVDYLAVLLHWSYFFVPYVVLVAMWITSPASIRPLIHLLILVFLVGLAIYALLPATPPWLAAAEPNGPHVYRILPFVGTSLDPATYQRVYENIGDPNPVAALPSLHFAITFALFLHSIDKHRFLRIAAAFYSLAMGLALVYLGEHYVVDILFGGLVAWVVWLVYNKRRITLAGPFPFVSSSR